MDHFSKALENAERDGMTVRQWVQAAPAEAGKPDDALATVLTGRLVSFDREHMRERHILCGQGSEDPLMADKYRLLRTQLLQRMKARGWRRLAITSPGAKAGKTMTSINLAISVARDGNHRVVLVDADLRKPSIAMELGFKADLGLIDYLADGVPLEEVFVTSDWIPNLSIVPGRRVAPEKASPELLNSARMLALLEQISVSPQPTLVLVDLPPVFVGDDVILLGEHLDSVLLIVEEGNTEVAELKSAAELLSRFNLIGTVLNKSAEKERGFSGYYHATGHGKREDQR